MTQPAPVPGPTGRTLRVALVNMPFADWNRPSYALSQLHGLAEADYAGRVEASVHYLNVEVARYLGVEAYEAITGRLEHLYSGLGDWFFRAVAFPDVPDNTDAYFRRYYRGAAWEEFREFVLRRRAGVESLCDELVERYDLASADVLGLTSMFAQTVPGIALARRVKARNADAVVAMGGANCETPMGGVLAESVPLLDYVFSGPALHSFPAFLDVLLAGREADLHRVPGLLTPGNRSDPKARASIGRDRDIDDYVAPRYDSFVDAIEAAPDLRAASDAEPVLFFETSRGCWWGERSHCTFCGLNGQSMGYRAMSPELAVAQFERLFAYAPWCTSYFCTDNIMPKNYPREVFPRLSPPPGASIYYEVKVPVSTADLAVLAAAGVNEVQPGIEALATSTLRLMGKGTTAFQNLQFLQHCVEFDIWPDWNLLIGFPGEDESVYEKYERDLPLLVHLWPPRGTFLVRFDRYSPYFTERGSYGLELRPMDFYSYVYPFDDAALEHLAYFFTDHGPAPYAERAIAWLTPLQRLIDAWHARWAGPGRPYVVLRDGPGDATGDGGDGGGVVEDGRGEQVVRVAVDALTRRVLATLASPKRVDQLAAELAAGPDEVAERVALLRHHRLLFEEDGRMLSLVTGAEASGLPGVGSRG